MNIILVVTSLIYKTTSTTGRLHTQYG